MEQKQFDKIKPLSNTVLNELADGFEGSLAFLCLNVVNNRGNASFMCNYDGNEELIFNAMLTLFRQNDTIGKLAQQAMLRHLHDETVKSYKLKDE